ncbi:MAG: hypothetical protein WCD44_01885 [Candidatus Babeliales bacterium]
MMVNKFFLFFSILITSFLYCSEQYEITDQRLFKLLELQSKLSLAKVAISCEASPRVTSEEDVQLYNKYLDKADQIQPDYIKQMDDYDRRKKIAKQLYIPFNEKWRFKYKEEEILADKKATEKALQLLSRKKNQ